MPCNPGMGLKQIWMSFDLNLGTGQPDEYGRGPSCSLLHVYVGSKQILA